MLEKLLQSKTRVKILTFFSLHIDSKVYIRELSRILNENVNSIRRELSNLENIKILISEEQGNLKYYSMNKQSPIYQDLINIFLKTEGVSKALKKELSNNEKIDMVFIYGSYASGTAKIDSDLDLFIIGDVSENFLIKKIHNLEKMFFKEINYSNFSFKEVNDRINNNDPFLNNIIKNPKIILINNEKHQFLTDVFVK